MPGRSLLLATVLVPYAIGPMAAQQPLDGLRQHVVGVPPMDDLRGPLAIRVVYPKWEDIVDARDSSFIFGSVGNGQAKVTVNGYQAAVWPNGAWFAWIPFPRGRDSLMEFTIVARAGGDSASLVYPVRRVVRFAAPPTGVWIDTTSLAPVGRLWWPAGEYIALSARATPGAEVRMLFPDGIAIPLRPSPTRTDVPWGLRAFGWDSTALRQAPDSARYEGVLRGAAIGSLGPILPVDTAATTPDDAAVTIEAALAGDTVRAVWPLRVAFTDTIPRAVVLDDDPRGTGETNGITIGRASPGATYHWFFPSGTTARVTGRLNGMVRLGLSATSSAWVPADEATPLPPGIETRPARIGFVTMRPLEDRVEVRIPVDRRVPYGVAEEGGTLVLRMYGVQGDLNWIRHGVTDRAVASVEWRQETADQVVIRFAIGGPLWGYRLRWDGTDLLLDLRRPPRVDPDHPLTGRLIVVDPGHPPVGARGPAGLWEPMATLAIAKRLRAMLEEAGARVVMTRTDDAPVDLLPRVRLADSVSADVLVSIHANALPDGVNPFVNNGSSAYYFHPHSHPLARDIQRAVVRQLGLRDLGVGRGNLALVRSPWMPAVLVEGMFIMLPDQEDALASAEGQTRYAQGVFLGLEAFFGRFAER